ncbi:MAG: magnesium transporter [Myxococcota bacterium]
MTEQNVETTRGKLLEEWETLAQSGDKEAIRQFLSALHPAHIADIIELVGSDEKMNLFSLLDPEKSGEVLFELNYADRDKIIDRIQNDELSEIVEVMHSDDAADIVGDLDADRAKEVLNSIEQEGREEIRTLLRFPPETAGGAMQVELCAVNEDNTVGETVELVREKAKEFGRIYNVFVVDNLGRLKGAVPLERLVLEPANRPIREIYDLDVVPIPVSLDQEEVALVFKRQDEPSLPVVDADGVLVGRITADDVIDILDEEHSEDILRMHGAGEDEKALDSPLTAVKNRLPWLITYLIAANITAFVVSLFEDTIERVVILAALMPIVGGVGGSAGTQSLAVIIRSMATGDMELSLFWRALRKEIAVGFVNGVVNGIFICLVVWLWRGNIWVGVVLGAAIVANQIIAGIAGTAVPTILKLCRIDPATASGVIVTTLTDLTGFSTLLLLASILIRHLL